MESRLAILGPKAVRCSSNCRPVPAWITSGWRPSCKCCRGTISTPSNSEIEAGMRTVSSVCCIGTASLFARHGVTLCISDHQHAPAPWTSTAPHVYVRGHGPAGNYKDNYSVSTLETWAGYARSWVAAGKIVYIFFDNDQKSAAPNDARRLIRLCARRASSTAQNLGALPAGC